MRKTKKTYIPRFAVICAAVVLLLGLASAAYAADLGGIRRNVQFWLRGAPADAAVEINGDGSYTVTYRDRDGVLTSGGGAAVNPDGTVRIPTEDEILAEMNGPQACQEDDGSVWVYWRAQKIEITNRFDKNGVCYVSLKDGDDVLYMTVKYPDFFTVDPDYYPDPDSMKVMAPE